MKKCWLCTECGQVEDKHPDDREEATVGGRVLLRVEPCVCGGTMREEYDFAAHQIPSLRQ